MSKLNFNLRPLVEFDVNNKEHRMLFAHFIQHRSWSKSPYRFIVPDVDQQFNLIAAISHKIMMYYLGKEFAQKSQRLVDKV